MNEVYTPLLQHVGQEIKISEAEINRLHSCFTYIEKSKHEYLIQEGKVAKDLYFILDGYVRLYHEEENGNETTTGLYTTNDFVTSFESFIKNSYAKKNIQCLSNCKLLVISKEDHEQLYTVISEWPMFCQNVYEQHILHMHDRIYALQNLSASDRYTRLLDKQPEIVLNIAVKYLASYLGIQPQSLSRIRKEIK